MNETRLRPSEALRAPIDALRPGDLSAPRGDDAGIACGDESGTITGASESASKGTAGSGVASFFAARIALRSGVGILGRPGDGAAAASFFAAIASRTGVGILGRATATSSKVAGLAIGIGDASGPRAAARAVSDNCGS